MNNVVSLLFYIKKSKADVQGNCNIYMRITIDGKRAEFSISRKVHPDKWMTKGQVVLGKNPEVNELNNYLSKVRSQLLKKHEELLYNQEAISALELRDAYLGKGKNYKMLLEIFQEHNDRVHLCTG